MCVSLLPFPVICQWSSILDLINHKDIIFKQIIPASPFEKWPEVIYNIASFFSAVELDSFYLSDPSHISLPVTLLYSCTSWSFPNQCTGWFSLWWRLLACFFSVNQTLQMRFFRMHQMFFLPVATISGTLARQIATWGKASESLFSFASSWLVINALLFQR